MAASHGLSCSPGTGSPPAPASSGTEPAPEVIRTANRLADNEGRQVVIDGLAVEIAGRSCIHLDRSDAIVPVLGRPRWEPALLDRPVRGRGTLSRHAEANDPVTGLSSLQLAKAVIEPLPIPVDNRIRTAPALRRAEGTAVEVEGMAYKSSNGPIVIVYGGLAYVRGVPMWDAATVKKTVAVRGTVRHPPMPPDAPEPGGSWTIEATGFEIVPSR